jgi:hypothetical protein
VVGGFSNSIQDTLGASQQNISEHLGILHAAGMVARAKLAQVLRHRADPAPRADFVQSQAARIAAEL